MILFEVNSNHTDISPCHIKVASAYSAQFSGDLVLSGQWRSRPT